ncbi:MAG: hypothetical protein AAFQ82_07150 [Myxococcota bacterium]
MELLSTRLHPKHLGAHRYGVSGVADRCDCVVLSDRVKPHFKIERRREPAETVFLSLRYPVPALRFFLEQVAPTLSAPFVLITGSEDVTLPRQTDHRFHAFGRREHRLIRRISKLKGLRHWFVENLDDERYRCMSPLPLGMSDPDHVGLAHYAESEPPPPLAKRNPRVLCMHRVRDGAQWQPRRRVSELARGPWG